MEATTRLWSALPLLWPALVPAVGWGIVILILLWAVWSWPQTREGEDDDDMELDLGDRSVVEREIAGALRSAIDAHGPIARDNTGSAAKRVYGHLKAVARRQRAG